MSANRRRVRIAAGIGIAVLLLAAAPAGFAAEPGPAALEPKLTADLDGRPIDPTKAAEHFCHDFEYPHIRCFGGAEDLEMETGAAAFGFLMAVDYLTVYDQSSFQGNYMHISQNYNALAVVGWNDRISSFKGRNSESGAFFVDWFAGGQSVNFCCNQQSSSLGGFNNTFSSVYRF